MERETQSYLLGSIHAPRLVPLLVLVVLFQLGTEPAVGAVFLLVVGFGILRFVGASRLAGYATLLAAVAVFVFVFVFQVATGPQDPMSDRDDQLEIAARALTAGENPWRPPIPTGNPNSTGPASILVAVPVVAVAGDIRPLTLLFYAVLFAFLIAGDLRQRNDSFPLVSLIFLAGLFGLQHTMLMALDDLYFGYAWLALAWLLVQRGYPSVAGVCVAFAALTRLSYGFPVSAFVFWYLQREQFRLVPGAKFLGSVLLGCVLITIPFVVIVGPDLLQKNPTEYNMVGQSWPANNLIFGFLAWFFGIIPWKVSAVLKVSVTLGAIGLVGHKIFQKDPSHPFWHLCAAGFAAHIAVYIPDLIYDYMPFFVIPGLLAIAYSKMRSPSTHATR